MFQVIHERIDIEGREIVKYRQAIGPYFSYKGAADMFASALQAIVIQERSRIGDCATCKSAEGTFISDIDCLETCDMQEGCCRYAPIIDAKEVLVEGEPMHRVKCAYGVVEDNMHDAFVVEECEAE